MAGKDVNKKTDTGKSQEGNPVSTEYPKFIRQHS